MSKAHLKTNQPSILMMGAYGLLGTPLSAWLLEKGYSVFRQGRGSYAHYQADPNNVDDLCRLIDDTSPDIVINLVAMTDVDACERDPQAAYLANVHSVDMLVRALKNTPVHLVQISTDQVYNRKGPHAEGEIDLCNVYALTKYTGELLAARVGATIVRTNFVGRSHVSGRSTFTDWLVEVFRERRPITLFDDVRFSAMHTSCLCHAIEHVANARLAGTYNVGSVDSLSKAAFALELAERLGLDSGQAIIGVAADVGLPARRPLDMSMAVTSFEEAFEYSAPTMDETLQRLTADYREDKK